METGLRVLTVQVRVRVTVRSEMEPAEAELKEPEAELKELEVELKEPEAEAKEPEVQKAEAEEPIFQQEAKVRALQVRAAAVSAVSRYRYGNRSIERTR